MSVLGDIARVSPAELERLRLDPDAYDYLSRVAPRIDLDRYWDGLRFVMDAAGFPVNPIGGGRPYPDEKSAWGNGMPHSTSCALTSDEVRQVAARLIDTRFSSLAVHLTGTGAARLYPAGYDWTSHAIKSNAARYFGMLDGFFQEAATYGECTVFWAA